VSRLYQPVDLIPAGDIQESRKVKKLEEISSKSARLLQGLSQNLQSLLFLLLCGLDRFAPFAKRWNSIDKVIAFVYGSVS